MVVSRLIALAARLLIVMCLVVLSFGAPAMASGAASDCATMMQVTGSASEQMAKTMPDMGKQCPYAAICAIAGLYVTPAPPTEYALAVMSDVEFLSFTDINGVGFVSSPPSRPPRF